MGEKKEWRVEEKPIGRALERERRSARTRSASEKRSTPPVPRLSLQFAVMGCTADPPETASRKNAPSVRSE